MQEQRVAALEVARQLGKEAVRAKVLTHSPFQVLGRLILEDVV